MKSKALFFSFCILGIVTSLHAQTVTDVDGNVYQTVTIGTQTWMQENLKVTHFRNGEAIATTKPGGLAICDSEKPVYQWAYNYNDTLTARFGRLYTWYAAVDNRNVCPAGWHIPNNSEWLVLRKKLGVDSLAKNMRKDSLLKVMNSNEFQQDYEKLISNFFIGGNKDFRYGERGCGGIFLQQAPGWWSATDRGSLIWNLGVMDVLNFHLKAYNEEINGYPIRCLKD